MVLTNYYLRVTPFTNPDVADKLQLKALKRSQPFMSTIQPFRHVFFSFVFLCCCPAKVKAIFDFVT